MMPKPGMALRRASLVAALCASVAGCAGGAGSLNSEGAAAFSLPEGISAQAAKDTVVVGQSTKADVMAALGKAIEIRFDSGYEVWVYRKRGSGGATRTPTEFAILFAPSGVVKKTRVRPPDGTPSE
jgi:hypothetical protein